VENKSKKKIILPCIIAAVLLVTIIVVILLLNKEESYRVVKIYELDGKATVTREETGEIEIYPNMVLASGDEVYLEEGLMTLKLDEDKFVYVEEKTRFSLLATGNASDSRTKIELKEGAIVNEITAPLDADASYEVHTQNSSMSVRGTTFRVAITYDENGVMYTTVSVFEGKVETQLVFKDGTMADPRLVESGKETIIFEDDLHTDYLEGITDIKYEELTQTAIETLIDLVKEGLQLAVSEEELLALLDGLSDKDVESDEGEEEPEQVEDVEQSEEDSSDDQESSGQEETSDVDSGEGEDEDDTEDISAPSASATTYTVTFMYNGTKFATQSVTAGGFASKPLLMPEASGAWDFDFSTPISKDITIEWK